jgi:hypothetical protein
MAPCWLRFHSLFFALVLASCASTQLGQASQAWQRIETEHFTVYTDLPKDDGVEQAQDYERWLSAFQQHGFQVTGRLPLRVNVVLFRSDADFRRYAGEDIDGYHVANVLYEPWIVMPARRQEGPQTVFRHELTHYISGLAVHRQPLWFAEGLASYFESAHFDSDGMFAIGSIPSNLAAVLLRYGRISVKRVFSGDVDRLSEQFYANSWLIVHYLMSEQGEAFEVYQRELARGKQHDEAWTTAFPNVSPAQLDSLVDEYLFGEAFAKYTLPVEVQPGVAVAHPLSLADEHALQGLLWKARCAGCSKLEQAGVVVRSMAAALQADPHQPQALAFRLQLEPAGRGLSQAKELARKHPDVWLAWMTLGVEALEAGEYLAVCSEFDPATKLRQLAPDSPYWHALAAFQFAQQGKRSLALTEANSARRKGPSNPDVLKLNVEVLSTLGACNELEGALALLRDVERHGEESDATPVAAESLRARCAQAQAGLEQGRAPDLNASM